MMEHWMAIGEATYLLMPSASRALKIPRLITTPDAPMMQNLMKTLELWKRIQAALRKNSTMSLIPSLDSPTVDDVARQLDHLGAADNHSVQQRNLKCIALDSKTLHVDAADDIGSNRAKAGRAIVDAGYACNVASNDVAEPRIESAVKPPFPRNAASAHIAAADCEVRALFERRYEPRHVGGFVREISVHLEYGVGMQ